MKKNLISVIILALLVVNIVLTGIMMASVLSTNKKTASLVTDVASAINLELEGGWGNPAEQAALDTQIFHAAILPAGEFEELI